MDFFQGSPGALTGRIQVLQPSLGPPLAPTVCSGRAHSAGTVFPRTQRAAAWVFPGWGHTWATQTGGKAPSSQNVSSALPACTVGKLMLQPWERQSKHGARQLFVFLWANSASSDWKPSNAWRLLKKQSVNPGRRGLLFPPFLCCFLSRLESSRISLRFFLLAISLAHWCLFLCIRRARHNAGRAQMSTGRRDAEERLAERLPRRRRAEHCLRRPGKWVN